MWMAVLVIERLKEKHLKPHLIKGVILNSAMPLFLSISFPIPLDEFRIIIKPSLLCYEVEEHKAVKDLLRKFMCLFDGNFLFLESHAEFKKRFLIVLEELVRNLLYAEGVFPSLPYVPPVFFLSGKGDV
jgi:hypothetical protein